jgi:hypothetical protein
LAFLCSDLFNPAKTNRYRLLRRSPSPRGQEEQHYQHYRFDDHISIHANRGRVYIFEDEENKGHSLAGAGGTSSAEKG